MKVFFTLTPNTHKSWKAHSAGEHSPESWNIMEAILSSAALQESPETLSSDLLKNAPGNANAESKVLFVKKTGDSATSPVGEIGLLSGLFVGEDECKLLREQVVLQLAVVRRELVCDTIGLQPAASGTELMYDQLGLCPYEPTHGSFK